MLNRRGFISGAIASSGLLPTLARAESRPTPSYPVLAGLTRGLMAERKIAGAAFALGRPRYRADFMAWGYSRSEEHTSELQSLMRISYAVFCLTQKTISTQTQEHKIAHMTH